MLLKIKKEEQAEKVDEIEKPEIIISDEPPQVLNAVVEDNNVEKTSYVEREPVPVSSTLNTTKQHTKLSIITAALMAVILAVGVFIYTENSRKGSRNLKGSTLNNGDGCMYWAGDHYQQIPCNQKMGETLVIALDTEKLNSFKKITRQDTITQTDIGRIWYIKLNNKVEFFTASGNYPLDPTLRLKPVTDYIISKYIDTARQGISH